MKEVTKYHRIHTFRNAYGEDEEWLSIDCAFIESGIKYATANGCKRILFGSLDHPEKAAKVGIAILQRFEDLEGLIWQNPIPKGTDLSILEKHAQLKYLSILEPNLSFDLSRFRKLEYIELYQSKGITGFESASKSLRRIKITHLTTDLRFLGSIKGLVELDIAYSNIESLAGIDESLKIERLSLIRCAKLKDVSHAASLKTLHSLHIEGSPLLTDLTALQKSQSLRTFWIKNKKIESCAFISKMKAIEFASINAEIMDNDLSPFLKSKSLEEVWFSPTKRTYIPQLSPDDINEKLQKKKGGAV